MSTSKNGKNIITKLRKCYNNLDALEMDLIFNASKYKQNGITIPENVMIESEIEWLEHTIRQVKKSIKGINTLL